MRLGFPHLYEPAIRDDEALKYRHDQPDGIVGELAVLAGQYLA